MNGLTFLDWFLGSIVSGTTAALVILLLAKLGHLPMIISVKMTKEEYDEYVEGEEEDEEET